MFSRSPLPPILFIFYFILSIFSSFFNYFKNRAKHGMYIFGNKLTVENFEKKKRERSKRKGRIEEKREGEKEEEKSCLFWEIIERLEKDKRVVTELPCCCPFHQVHFFPHPSHPHISRTSTPPTSHSRTHRKSHTSPPLNNSKPSKKEDVRNLVAQKWSVVTFAPNGVTLMIGVTGFLSAKNRV